MWVSPWTRQEAMHCNGKRLSHKQRTISENLIDPHTNKKKEQR